MYTQYSFTGNVCISLILRKFEQSKILPISLKMLYCLTGGSTGHRMYILPLSNQTLSQNVSQGAYLTFCKQINQKDYLDKVRT